MDVATPRTPYALRFRYSKVGKIRFTSQRDVARMWERALRRSGLAVAWSEGFSPRPLLSFGLALPTCCESRGEYLDIRLDPARPMPVSLTTEADEMSASPGIQAMGDLIEQMSELLPYGVQVQAGVTLENGVASLQQEVTSCSWEMEVLGVVAEELRERIERLLDAPSVPVRRERKGRQVEDDLRPSVLSLHLIAGADGASSDSPNRIFAELATQPRGVRPKELLEGLGTDLVLVRACRTHQWIERDGARYEPLPFGGKSPNVDAPHAQERAS